MAELILVGHSPEYPTTAEDFSEHLSGIIFTAVEYYSTNWQAMR